MDTNPPSRFRKFIVDLKKFDVLQTPKSEAFGSVSTVKDQETGNIYAAIYQSLNFMVIHLQIFIMRIMLLSLWN